MNAVFQALETAPSDLIYLAVGAALFALVVVDRVLERRSLR